MNSANTISTVRYTGQKNKYGIRLKQVQSRAMPGNLGVEVGGKGEKDSVRS